MLAQPITDGPHETPKLAKKGIPFLSVEAIVNNKLDFTRKRGYISLDYNNQCNKKYKPQLYDVYLVKSGSTVGKVAIVETNTVFNIWSPLAAMRVNSFNNPYFLYYLLQTDKLQDQIKQKSKGGTQPNLSMRILEKCSTAYTDLKEETQIASLLDKVDQQLVLQQRKLEHLKLLKKAMLQQLFTNDKTPILRFKEFNSAWEQRKLGDLANILRGASPRPIKDKKWFDPNSKIGWIRISDVTAQNGKVYVLNQHLSKEGQKKTRVVHPQTLLLSIAASVGYPVITYIETGVHDGFVIFDHPQFNLDFMFFKLQEIQKFWNKYGQSGSQININSSIVANTKILIPTNKEQRYISIILTKVEKSITLQLQNINRFEQMKKFLLQNMFI